MLIKSVPRECPVCSSRSKKALHHQQFVSGPITDSYTVVVCSSCGCGYADGIPTQAELDKHYIERSKYSYDHASGSETKWDFKRFQLTVEQVRDSVKDKSVRILDVGCATGGLLETFKREGYPNVLGVDPSPKCAEFAKRLYDISVIQATIDQLRTHDSTYDLITLVGVAEHLREVSSSIEVVAGLLNQGGLLYCAVPDVEHLLDNPTTPFQQFSVEHVNFFSAVSLERLFAEHDFVSVRSWTWNVEWSEGVMESTLSAIFQRSGGAPKRFDDRTEPALKQYIDYSLLLDGRIKAEVERLQRSQEPIFVWGAGTLTRRLLAETSLAATNILGFIDSDPKMRGASLLGIMINTPETLLGRSETIVISAGAFEREIAEAIRGKYMLLNPIIALASSAKY